MICKCCVTMPQHLFEAGDVTSGGLARLFSFVEIWNSSKHKNFIFLPFFCTLKTKTRNPVSPRECRSEIKINMYGKRKTGQINAKINDQVANDSREFVIIKFKKRHATFRGRFWVVPWRRCIRDFSAPETHVSP